ncbi:MULTISPECIES: glycosyltransferase [Staphylococcus]|uniref:glycosyltransferase n=1 Tax=Staphylococcus TaxID=1279 RepID=UPI0008A5DC29|nr:MULTISPECIES: glycosyltransferase [Staphylococcus]MBS9538859.1 glycosyltransferase [Staphylococcus hominis subsp. novobiosepticus]OFN26475.1 hypothetical protein HMPREF2578_09970 [Staphylococcus sp. HMSC072H03]WRY66035.1 glycosyltransferase [Staphylococcus hominis]
MKKQLILITNYYPFYKGEEYLESEINYLAEKFDEIYIIPTMINNKMNVTRILPQNAKLINLKSPQSKINKILNMIKNSREVLFKTKNLKKIIKGTKFNIYKIVYNLYIETRTIEIYKNLLALQKIPKNSSEGQIYIYSYWFYVTANLAIKIKNEFYNDQKIPIISRGHGYDINDYLKPFSFLPLREYLLDGVDRLYTVSNQSKNYLKNKFPSYSNKIEMERLGVQSSLQDEKINNLKIIVSCSTIRKLKRLDIIIDALSRIEDCNFKWIHIGDGESYEKISNYAKEKLEENQFQFVGRLENNEVLNFYKEVSPHCFINMSDSEGVPVSIMEAMAYSIPVIASNVGGTKEIVNNNNGFLIDNYENVDLVATKIKKILTMDQEQYLTLKNNAYNTWKNEWNASLVYKKFANNIVNMFDKRSGD